MKQQMSEIVAFKMTPAERRQLEQYAKKSQRTTSNVIRLALSLLLHKKAGAVDADTGKDDDGR